MLLTLRCTVAAALSGARSCGRDEALADWREARKVRGGGCTQAARQAFIDFIVESKTVALEDLAAEFGLRVQARPRPWRVGGAARARLAHGPLCVAVCRRRACARRGHDS